MVHSLNGDSLSITVVHDAPNMAQPVHSATHWSGTLLHQQHSRLLPLTWLLRYLNSWVSSGTLIMPLLSADQP